MVEKTRHMKKRSNAGDPALTMHEQMPGAGRGIAENETSSDALERYKRLTAYLESIIEYSYDGIWVSNKDGVTLRVNKAICDLNRIKPEDVVGINVRDLVKNGLFEKSITLEVLRKKRPVTMVQAYKGGRKALSTGTPVFNHEGDVDFVVVNARDITVIEQLAIELQESREVSQGYYSQLKEREMMDAAVENIVASSEEMRQVLKTCMRISQVDAMVLLLGESGVGKSMLASYIHRLSDRSQGPFIQLNCSAIPETLLESELFGYEKGAFTGARNTGKAGLFEMADNGILFLDEIGDISLNVQVKLLKFLENKEILRLGGTRNKVIDTRIITATNKDLRELVKRGAFREDLFYRLNTLPIHIPPLRERRSDILPLTQYFLACFNDKYGMEKKLAADALRLLCDYAYPGNVRELSSLLENLVLVSEDEVIRGNDFPSRVFQHAPEPSRGTKQVRSLRALVEAHEYGILKDALMRHGSIRKAAKSLGTSHSSIIRRMQKYGITQ